MAWLTIDTDEILCDEDAIWTIAGSEAIVSRDEKSHKSSWIRVHVKEWGGKAWQCEECGWLSIWQTDRCSNCKSKMIKPRNYRHEEMTEAADVASQEVFLSAT